VAFDVDVGEGWVKMVSAPMVRAVQEHGLRICRIWCSISRTVSDDTHCGWRLLGPRFRRQAPRLRRAAKAALGLDRSAGPSNSGDRAADALPTMLRL